MDAVAGGLAGDPIEPGDRVCILGFTSVDYTTIDVALVLLGAVSVPLQASAAVAALGPIVAETEPAVIASSVDYLSVAVGLVLTGHAPERLVVFDYQPQVDDHREAVDAARARLAEMADRRRWNCWLTCWNAVRRGPRRRSTPGRTTRWRR